LFTNSSEAASMFGLRQGCVASSAWQWHAVVCPCWLPDKRFSLMVYAFFAVGSMVWLRLQRGSFRAVVKTWLATCAAALSFHVVLL
jgi:hypothetical protein